MSTPRLLDQVRGAARLRHLSLRTEQAYVRWIRRFVFFHGKRHPNEMGVTEIRAFLSHLATAGNVAASTQNQALAALLFLYRNVLELELPLVDGVVRARKPARLPVVLTRPEVLRILGLMHGTPYLVASLLNRSGLRLLESLRLRVKDLDFEMRQLVVRDGKGQKDRVTMLPARLVPTLERHLEDTRRIHQRDLADGFGEVHLPYALSRKYPGAARTWGWQYVFPARRRSPDPRPGAIRRHHLAEATIQHAVHRAVRHHLLEDGYDIRTVQELLGHRDVRIYTDVLNRGGHGVRSPLDRA